MTFKSASVSQQSNSSRRALLLGLTLAEIMLILLFALLLLLGALGEELKSNEMVLKWGDAISDAFSNSDRPFTKEPPKEFQEFIEKAISFSNNPTPASEDWMRITNIISNSTEGDLSLAEALQEKSEELKAIKSHNTELTAKLDEAAKQSLDNEIYSNALENQIRVMRAGVPPPCLHDPSQSPDSLRGPSQPIGVVEFKSEVIRFNSINTNALNGVLVDFWGKQVNMTPILEIINTIPVATDLSISEFRDLGAKFREVGELDTEEHGRCMFTMDYVMDNFESALFIKDVFESYFLKQRRVVSTDD